MPPIALQSILDDPLVGCLPIVQHEGNGTNMLRSLLMRLRLFLSEARSEAIGEQVIAESFEIGINQWEYVINEVQYELRRCGQGYSEMFETVVLNNWTRDLMKRFPEDVVYEFVRKVRQSRDSRKR